MSYFDTADILQTTAEDGEVRCNLGDSRDGTGYVNSAAVWGLDGFFSRPNNPTADGAAQGLYVVDGNQVRVVASRDNRFAAQTGALQPGDRAIVTDGPARILLKQAKAVVNLYTENAKDNGSSMMVDVNGDLGSIKLVCGGSVFEITKDSITMMTSGQGFAITDKGVSVWGKHFACNTGSGNFGLVVPTPPYMAPVAPAMSVLVGPTGLGAAPSTTWTMTIK